MIYTNMLFLEMLDNTKGVVYKITDTHDRKNDTVTAVVKYEGGLYMVVVRPIKSSLSNITADGLIGEGGFHG